MTTVLPTPTPPELIADLELPASTFSSPSMRWSDDGSRLFVERAVDSRWWPWLHDARADLGAVAFALALLIAFAWIVRTLRRPRRVGHAYCPRCNQDLTGDERTSIVPERCPECGRGVGSKMAVPGRRLVRRVLPVTLLAAALALGGAIVWWNGVTTTPVYSVSPAWPAAICGRWFPNWPMWRAPSRWRPDYEIDVFEVDSNGSVRPLDAVPIGDTRAWDVSADGRTIAWTDFNERSGWELAVKWTDVATGAERRAVIGDASMGFISISGFTPDWSAIVVPRVNLVRYPPKSTSAPASLVVHTMDIASGTVREIGTSTVTASRAGSGWELPAVGAAVSAGPNGTWATIAFHQRTGTLGDVFVGGPDGTHPVTMQPNWSRRMIELRSLRLGADGTLQIGDDYAVNLETGTLVSLGLPMTSATWLADPQFAGATPSPDGTHAAKVTVTPLPGAAPPRNATFRLRVWRRR